MNKEYLIDDILSSLDQQKRLKAPESIREKVLSKTVLKSNSNIIPLRYVLAVAACLACLVYLNVHFLKQTKKQHLSDQSVRSFNLFQNNYLY